MAFWSLFCIKRGQTSANIIGHSSNSGMRMHNPFVYLVQVRRRYGKCLRSNDPFLLVLPCPTQLCPLLCDLAMHVADLLLLAGDIETNPGPDLAQIFKQLEAIAGDIKSIKEERLASIEAKLENMAALDKKILDCIDQVTNMQKVVASLELKLDDLENRSRRSNLLVYGITEDPDENSESLEQLFNDDIAKNILKIEPVAIERIHRLGKPSAEKTRPVILKLLDYREKTLVLKNCSKHKGSEYAISEDFSARVRDVRKKLWISAKALKDSGAKVALVFDKIRINGEMFQWDEENNCRVPAKTQTNATTNSCPETNASTSQKNEHGKAPNLRPRHPTKRNR
ncbi:uncharacterized protein LOC144095625 [Amblyomma americanum]